jgi:hypothetical protein
MLRLAVPAEAGTGCDTVAGAELSRERHDANRA